MASRRRVPVLEALESRELLMGFSMNPIRTPIAFALTGTAQGTALPAPAGEIVNASGVISPIGLAHVTGSLQVVGKTETGVLKLHSGSSNLQLFVYGTRGQPLHFQISGTTNVPNSNFVFRVVDGSGTLNTQTVRGPRGYLVSLEFIG